MKVFSLFSSLSMLKPRVFYDMRLVNLLFAQSSQLTELTSPRKSMRSKDYKYIESDMKMCSAHVEDNTLAILLDLLCELFGGNIAITDRKKETVTDKRSNHFFL